MTSETEQEAANENSEEKQAASEEQPNIEKAQEESAPTEELDPAEEYEKMRDQWLRAVAETENVRKRAERDQQEMSKFAVSGFARDMVSVLENLIRASESIPKEERKENQLLNTLAEGVDLTLNELLSIFERHKIKRIDPMGEKFDHNYHQAVAQVETADSPPGTVVQVVQAGYILHDRLLRPAMVAVSKQGEMPKQVDTTA